MFVRLGNTPLRYAWGAPGRLTEFLGADGALLDPEYTREQPPVQAEIWFGAHHGSPTRILQPARTGGAGDLAEWLEADSGTALGELACGLRDGDGARLPFLLKVLAAGQPLSLQVHPDLERARAGFAAENAAGIPLDSPVRNYKDPFHKPELLVALSDEMHALAGFRDLDEARELVADVAAAAERAGCTECIREFERRVVAIDGDDSVRELLRWVLAGGDAVAVALPAIDAWTAEAPTDDRFATERANIRRIRLLQPDDPSVLTVLLLNHVVLRRGEAVHVRAGVLHAYLEGVGLEIMAASDNVLRGGLTPKHVDVEELLAVLDPTTGESPRLAPEPVAPGVVRFLTGLPDFALSRVDARGEVDAELALRGPGIVLNLGDEAHLTGATGETIVLGRGDAVYATPDEGPLRLHGADVDLALASVALADGATVPTAE